MNMRIFFDDLVPGQKPDDDLTDLSHSIEWDGLQFPLMISPLGNGDYEVVDGNRRYYAILALMQKDDAFVWDGHNFRHASVVFAEIDCTVQ